MYVFTQRHRHRQDVKQGQFEAEYNWFETGYPQSVQIFKEPNPK